MLQAPSLPNLALYVIISKKEHRITFSRVVIELKSIMLKDTLFEKYMSIHMTAR